MVTADHWFGPPLVVGSPPPADSHPMLVAPPIGQPTGDCEISCFGPKEPTGRKKEKKKKKKRRRKEKKKKKKEKKRKRKEKEKKKKKRKENAK